MKREKKEKTLAMKLFLCLIYIMIMTVLFVASYKIFQEKKKIIPWDEVKTTEEYTYMDIVKMSEKFAYDDKEKIGIHFVIVKEETGLWHTYLIAINDKDYPKFKNMIDYSYERTEKEPTTIRVYGYPVITPKKMKELAIKNITNFLPSENEVKITEENYESYLTNSYLDTTREEKDQFNIILSISFGLLFIVFALMIMTIFDKGKKVKKKKKKRKKEVEN